MKSFLSGLFAGILITGFYFTFLKSSTEVKISQAPAKILQQEESSQDFEENPTIEPSPTTDCSKYNSKISFLERENQRLIQKLQTQAEEFSSPNTKLVMNADESPLPPPLRFDFEKHRQTEIIKDHLSKAELPQLKQMLKSESEARSLRLDHRKNGFSDSGSFRTISEEIFKNQLNGVYSGTYLKMIKNSEDVVTQTTEHEAKISFNFYKPQSDPNSQHTVKIEIPNVTNSHSSSNNNTLVSSTQDGRLIVNLGENNFLEEMAPDSLRFVRYSEDEVAGILILNPQRTASF